MDRDEIQVLVEQQVDFDSCRGASYDFIPVGTYPNTRKGLQEARAEAERRRQNRQIVSIRRVTEVRTVTDLALQPRRSKKKAIKRKRGRED